MIVVVLGLSRGLAFGATLQLAAETASTAGRTPTCVSAASR